MHVFLVLSVMIIMFQVTDRVLHNALGHECRHREAGEIEEERDRQQGLPFPKEDHALTFFSPGDSGL